MLRKANKEDENTTPINNVTGEEKIKLIKTIKVFKNFFFPITEAIT